MSVTKGTKYQTLMAELDAIIESLQSPDMDIDEALVLYKRGQKIIKDLEVHLHKAELSVRKLNIEMKN